MGRKKRFDKKSSLTFKLVHRSQRDPLAADETAPQHVLVPMEDQRRHTRVSDDNNGVDSKSFYKQKEEQKKYGIYFDDDYNYLQHLRDVNYVNEWQPIEPNEKKCVINDSKIRFPSSLFPSNIEEKEGLLNKAVLPVGPQPDWDPDLVAAMDDDFDFSDPNNQIDDDFIGQAEVVDIDGEDDDHEWQDVTDSEGSNNGSEDVSTVCGDDRSDIEPNHFSDEETKSHFTNYSMSSSVIRRNQNLTILDQRFETLYENQYANDCDIGALDFDEIEGCIDPNKSELMSQLVNEYEDAKNHKEIYENDFNSKSFNDIYKRNNENNEEMTEMEINENSNKGNNHRYDCESIISTYSNLYNHPKIIRENNFRSQRVRISDKTGLPIGVLDKPGLTAKKLAKLDAINNINNGTTGSKSVRSSMSRLSELSQRTRGETPEERNLRKNALKEYRRERRSEKKANRIAFRSEHIRHDKEVINLQKNINSIKLI